MAQLIVTLHGQEVASLSLEDGHEYLVGRGEDADLILPSQKGISRHHLKFYQRNNIWIVELLARFGSLLRAGQRSEVFELDEDCHFSAPPFEFNFSLREKTSPKTFDASMRMPTVHTQGHTKPSDPDELALESSAPSTPRQNERGNHEPTMVGVSTQLVPYVRIINKTSGKEEIIKLEGDLWVAGRDASCEILLEENRSSRRHFELSRTKEGFFITDLDSANGTLLNDEALPSDEPWQLTSGDVIRVAGTKVIFEIHDPTFNQRLPALLQQPLPSMQQQNFDLPIAYGPGHGALQSYGSGVAVLKVEKAKFDFKKHRVRIAIAVLIPILLYGYFKDDNPHAPHTSENSSSSPNFEQLTPEKKQAVKNSFNLAMNMYMQTRYQLCMAELKKLHEMVPSYENSKELLNYCEHGSELLRKKEDSDRLAREQAESERAIVQVVEDCSHDLQPTTTLEDIRICLAPAIERSPEHPSILALLDLVKGRQDKRQAKKVAADNQRQRRELGLRVFEKAKEFYKLGELSKAISEYDKFLSGGYSELSEERTQAQRSIAQVRKELGNKVSGLVRSCRESLEKSQYKPAYVLCTKALQEDPQNNDAKNLRLRILADMRRELKSMYEDSVLEESMGNIDSAKERWKQIMDKGLPGDEYHNKAKRNLQKYGAS